MVKLQGLEMGKLSQRSLRRIILSANFYSSFPLVPTEVIRQNVFARSTLLTVFCHFVVPMQQPQIFHAVRKSFYQTQLIVTVVRLHITGILRQPKKKSNTKSNSEPVSCMPVYRKVILFLLRREKKIRRLTLINTPIFKKR